MTINNNYDDIINLPHYTSSRRNCISASDRAAQFSSFAALTGFEAEIDEAARFTDSRLEADDDRFDEIMKEVVAVCAKVEPDCKIEC